MGTSEVAVIRDVAKWLATMLDHNDQVAEISMALFWAYLQVSRDSYEEAPGDTSRS